MDQKYIDLFDRYTHGQMKRRDFLEKLTLLAGGTAAATALLPALENNYAMAEMVAENDTRILPETITYESTVGKVSGYLVKQKQFPKAGGVIVISENRGLNPHIKDVARRLATEGFLALAPDYLSIRGGTPADADKARDMIGTLKPEETVAISRASLAALAARPDCTGKVGRRRLLLGRRQGRRIGGGRARSGGRRRLLWRATQSRPGGGHQGAASASLCRSR